MTDSIPEPVASFIDAVNWHDRDGFLDAFTAQGVVDDWGRTFTGRDEIDGWSQKEFIGATGTLTPEDVDVDADTVTVTRNEIMTALNAPERFILAVVVVDGGHAAAPRYVRRPFVNEPDAGAVSVTFRLGELLSHAEELRR